MCLLNDCCVSMTPSIWPLNLFNRSSVAASCARKNTPESAITINTKEIRFMAPSIKISAACFKPEIRNPKSEKRPKSEDRRPGAVAFFGLRISGFTSIWLVAVGWIHSSRDRPGRDSTQHGVSDQERGRNAALAGRTAAGPFAQAAPHASLPQLRADAQFGRDGRVSRVSQTPRPARTVAADHWFDFVLRLGHCRQSARAGSPPRDRNARRERLELPRSTPDCLRALHHQLSTSNCLGLRHWQRLP